jgi:pyridoxine kinase
LTDFDVMLSGYAPSAAVVEAVGAIGIDLQQKAEKKPGSFFWGKPSCFIRLKYLIIC